jgi:hypothetical protein
MPSALSMDWRVRSIDHTAVAKVCSKPHASASVCESDTHNHTSPRREAAHLFLDGARNPGVLHNGSDGRREALQ